MELKETSLLDEVEKTKVQPRKTAKTTARPNSPNQAVYNRAAVRKALISLYEAAGEGVKLLDPVCGSIFSDDDFVNGAVESWLNLAETSPFWKKTLMLLTQASGWGGVAMAHLPLVMMVATHHGNFGSSLANLVSGRAAEDAREAYADTP